MDELIKFFKDGGPFMLLNLGFLAFSFAVIGERMVKLFFSLPTNEKVFVSNVARFLQAGNLDAATKACGSDDRALPIATRSLLKLLRNGYESPMIAVEEAMLEARPKVQHRIGWLWSIANIATLIGLIGTILGLIGAFAAIATAPPAERANILSLKISEAMNNTAFGLIIATFCITAHLVINNQAVKMMEAMEHALFHFINLHAQWRKGNRQDGAPGAR